MARKSFFLLALAVVAIISIFANSADAKVRKHMIGGIPYLTTGTDGQVIDSVGWVKKGGKKAFKKAAKQKQKSHQNYYFSCGQSAHDGYGLQAGSVSIFLDETRSRRQVDLYG